AARAALEQMRQLAAIDDRFAVAVSDCESRLTQLTAAAQPAAVPQAAAVSRPTPPMPQPLPPEPPPPKPPQPPVRQGDDTAVPWEGAPSSGKVGNKIGLAVG